jgi:pseudouridine synthase
MAKRPQDPKRAGTRAPVRIPARGAGEPRRTRRSGPTHDYQDDRRGPRIQKVLAESGVDSRRACEALVAEGRVTVNGQVLDGLPAWVNPQEDDIRVDGRRLRAPERHVYVMLFKPKGVLSTNRDPEGRALAKDLVEHPSKARLYPVGRLDIDSSGLLLLTNDGELANRLTHPRFEVRKGYEVTVSGSVTEETLAAIGRAIGESAGAEASTPRLARAPGRRADHARGREPRPGLAVLKRDAQKTLLYMEVRENRGTPLRQLLQTMGHPVKKLRRVRMGPLQLKGLQIGQWRDLTRDELSELRGAAFAPPQARQVGRK